MCVCGREYISDAKTHTQCTSHTRKKEKKRRRGRRRRGRRGRGRFVRRRRRRKRKEKKRKEEVDAQCTHFTFNIRNVASSSAADCGRSERGWNWIL